VDKVGGLQVGHRGVAEAQARGGAGDPAGGRRVSGLQEPAQHRPVQLTQRPGQRCLAAGAAYPAWLIRFIRNPSGTPVRRCGPGIRQRGRIRWVRRWLAAGGQDPVDDAGWWERDEQA
jgi:hypothetical protein